MGTMRIANEDNQFPHLRNCQTSSLSATTIRGFSVPKDILRCDSEHLVFMEGHPDYVNDFNITTYDPDGITINREEDVSDEWYAQTRAGKGSIEWTKSIEIKANMGDRWQQWVVNLQMNEGLEGTDGEQLVTLSNSGLFYFEEHVFNIGTAEEYRTKIVYPNLRITTWANPMSGIQNNETVYTYEFMVEEQPVFETKGKYPVNVLPNNVQAVTTNAPTGITASFTDTEFTLSGYTITDPEPVIPATLTTNAILQVVTLDTMEEVGRVEFMADGLTDAVLTEDLTTYAELGYILFYKLSESQAVTDFSDIVTKAVLPFAEKSKKKETPIA